VQAAVSRGQEHRTTQLPPQSRGSYSLSPTTPLRGLCA